MNRKWTRIGWSIFLFGCLVGIRYYESYFYDPLQLFFKQAYLHEKLPALDYGPFYLHLVIRYMLNSGLSILLIWVIFRDKSFVKFSVYFYGIALFLLLLLFILLIYSYQAQYYLPLFYVRRFLIQPLFILLLLPAFYYQKMIGRQNS